MVKIGNDYLLTKSRELWHSTTSESFMMANSSITRCLREQATHRRSGVAGQREPTLTGLTLNNWQRLKPSALAVSLSVLIQTPLWKTKTDSSAGQSDACSPDQAKLQPDRTCFASAMQQETKKLEPRAEFPPHIFISVHTPPSLLFFLFPYLVRAQNFWFLIPCVTLTSWNLF